MRILVLQFSPDTRGRPIPRFDPQLGTLLALLARHEHQVTLEGLPSFDLARLKTALARGLPQLIYADIAGVCVDAARRTLEFLSRHEHLPIVAGGSYPTVEPAASLSLPGVSAVAVGEGDASLVTYLERLKDPAVTQVVWGIWARDENGLAEPELPPLVENLNSLPLAHRDSFGHSGCVHGDGEMDVAIGRGCPQRCAYCVNPTLRDLYAGRGTWVRRRSAGNILAEIARARQEHAAVRSVRILDHSFALDGQWLAEFLPAYQRQCGLPFRCHLRANATDEATVLGLAAAGCRFADVEIISGSDFLRNEILEMDLAEGQIRDTFAWLHRAGIATRAIAYLGAPYESEASLAETAALLSQLKPHTADIRAYYPWPGTPARQLCQEQGWLHARGEEQYHLDRTGIDMPACRPEIVAAFMRRLRANLARNRQGPWWRRWWPTQDSRLDPPPLKGGVGGA